MRRPWNTWLARITPLADDLRAYTLAKLRADLVAGVTVAVVALPQSMAYALIAKVPPVYGIYTAMVQGLVAALFTSSSHLSTGPINTLSLLVASAVARLAETEDERVRLVLLLTFLVGVIQAGCALARVGGLVRYVSHEVIVGFTAGAGILIAVGQVPNFLGVDVSTIRHHLPGVLGALERLGPVLHEVKPHAVAIGSGTLLLVIAARMISRFIPGPLLAAAGGAVVVWWFGWSNAVLPLVGDLPQGLPALALPVVSWANLESLFGAALALALVGMLEAYSIAKAIAGRTGEIINPNQEFLAQGASNLVSSFFQCIPGSGSFSRSALNFAAGARTRFAGIFNSAFVAVLFLLLAGQARFIPLSSLAAILFVIAYGLVDWRHLVRVLRTNRDDALVCFVTLLATLVIPLEFAIFVGVLLNIGTYIRRSAHLHVAEMVSTPGGPILEKPLADNQGRRSVLFLQLEGDLFFGIADELQQRLLNVARGGARVVILRLKRTHSIDSSVLEVLERFIRHMRDRGGHVLLCGVRPQLMRTLGQYGLMDLIGKDHVFEAGVGLFASSKRAIQRARELVGSSLDVVGIDFEDDADAWAYDI